MNASKGSGIRRLNERDELADIVNRAVAAPGIVFSKRAEAASPSRGRKGGTPHAAPPSLFSPGLDRRAASFARLLRNSRFLRAWALPLPGWLVCAVAGVCGGHVRYGDRGEEEMKGYLHLYLWAKGWNCVLRSCGVIDLSPTGFLPDVEELRNQKMEVSAQRLRQDAEILKGEVDQHTIPCSRRPGLGWQWSIDARRQCLEVRVFGDV